MLLYENRNGEECRGEVEIICAYIGLMMVHVVDYVIELGRCIVEKSSYKSTY